MPDTLKNIFGSPITIGAFSAILLNIFLPEEHLQLEENDYDPEAHLHTVLQNPQDDSAEEASNSSRNELNVAPRTS